MAWIQQRVYWRVPAVTGYYMQVAEGVVTRELWWLCLDFVWSDRFWGKMAEGSRVNTASALAQLDHVLV